MRDMQPVIGVLLARWPDGFRNKHLAQALGISQSRACRLLKQLVLSGELARADEERPRYVRGAHCDEFSRGVVVDSFGNSFWRDLVQRHYEVGYVALGGIQWNRLRTRQQVQSLLSGFRGRFLIIDFQGVHSISVAACDEMLFKLPHRNGFSVQSINLEPSVAQIVRRVFRFGNLAVT
jgi:hypothetical protein